MKSPSMRVWVWAGVKLGPKELRFLKSLFNDVVNNKKNKKESND